MHSRKLNTINDICADLKQIEANHAFYIDELLAILNGTLATLVLDLDKKTTLERVERFCKLHPEIVRDRINQKFLNTP